MANPNSEDAKHPSGVPTIAASSVYSQPTAYSPNPRATLAAPWHDEYHEDISPPSTAGREIHGDGRVSPIDEHPLPTTQPERPSPRYTSQIPRPQQASSGTRWDTYSGEPTSNASGKTGQVTPGNPPYNSNDNENIPPGNSSFADQLQKRNSLTERASRFAPKKFAKSIKPQEPWSRAIGRTNFVDPVNDTPQEQRIAIPPRNPKRTNATISPVESPENDNYASRSIGDDSNFASRRDNEDTLAALTARRVSDVDDKEHPVSRFSWSTHATGTTHRTSGGHDSTYDDPSTPPPMPLNMSIFRKSVGSKNPDSPSPSPSTQRKQLPTPKQDSILDRKRPIPREDLATEPLVEPAPSIKSSTSTARKPVGFPKGLGISTAPGVKHTNSIYDSSSTHSKTSSKEPRTKALPPAPRILDSTKNGPVDHVDELRAQLDDLSLRRTNINTAIHNLTRAQARNQNPMVTDWRAARAAERKVQALRDELAEINREEHDVGLRLHRAYKRRERQGDWEGTSALWVRRVTN
ncbi:hypothetical protein NA57DRAFT_56882 [Rhizodiscina lignyota]|uniref:Uncharacterized protein n=1 Tax=Rhizodiscina lignyota TaxID=1504668 RepID=A0A9P4M7V2_9PEZI|nr:hypothetical protein NA57DRAFT_56882 [Rhizodiscina lignyota]